MKVMAQHNCWRKCLDKISYISYVVITYKLSYKKVFDIKLWTSSGSPNVTIFYRLESAWEDEYITCANRFVISTATTCNWFSLEIGIEVSIRGRTMTSILHWNSLRKHLLSNCMFSVNIGKTFIGLPDMLI